MERIIEREEQGLEEEEEDTVAHELSAMVNIASMSEHRDRKTNAAALIDEELNARFAKAMTTQGHAFTGDPTHADVLLDETDAHVFKGLEAAADLGGLAPVASQPDFAGAFNSWDLRLYKGL